MLHAVIKHHSKLDEDFYLWVNQICIDQDSVEDKSNQVATMGDIFKQAMYVVAWLSSSPEVDRAAAVLHEFMPEKPCDIVPSKGEIIVAPSPVQNAMHRRIHAKRSIYQAFQAFLDNEYWTHTWILQELILAKQMHVLTKNCSLRSDIILTLLEVMKITYTPKITNLSHLLFLFLREYGSGKSYSLEMLARFSTRSHCADPRDKVFAVRSLMSKQVQTRTVADYAMSVEEVFLTAADVMLERDGRFRNQARASLETVIELGSSMMPKLRGELDRLLRLDMLSSRPKAPAMLERRAIVMRELRAIVGKENPDLLLTESDSM